MFSQGEGKLREEVTGLFWTAVLNWHIDNERLYPWRNTRDPYQVLIAEFLLQQTNADLVLRTYPKFVTMFPTVVTLADARIEDLLRLVGPIGLRYRAARMKLCAQSIRDSFNGRIPQDRGILLKLPGVGPYIADAVLCYAFHQPTVPVDTNVIRVMSRFFDLRSSKSRARTDRTFIADVVAHYPHPASRAENLAVLDFASMVCTARKPRCISCPVAPMCEAALDHG